MKQKIILVALALALPSAWAETRQNVPPVSATNQVQKAKTTRLRGCFRDGDKDGKCDRSVNDGGKCRANCVDPDVKPARENPSLKPPSKKTGEEKNLGKLTLPDCRHGLRFGCIGCGACLKG